MEDDPEDPSPAAPAEAPEPAAPAVPAPPPIESAPSLQRAESAPPPPTAIVEVDLVDEEEEPLPKRQKSLLDFQGSTRSGSTSASQPSWGHAKDVTCLVCEIRIRSMKHGFDI